MDWIAPYLGLDSRDSMHGLLGCVLEGPHIQCTDDPSDGLFKSRQTKRSQKANSRKKRDVHQSQLHLQATIESETSSSSETEDLKPTPRQRTYEIDGTTFVRKFDVAGFRPGKNTRSIVYAEDRGFKTIGPEDTSTEYYYCPQCIEV